MKPVSLSPCRALKGTVILPGDKSISHRAAILASMAAGRCVIDNFLFSDDGLVTLQALTHVGVDVSMDPKKRRVVIRSDGHFQPPRRPLQMGESGTSARILMGVLAGAGVVCEMTAEESLLRRPMSRVIDPLRLMGARISAVRRHGQEWLPVCISPSKLRGLDWKQRVASAQVKSAILLAGLSAQGPVTVREPVQSRDHTERMLRLFGAKIKTKKDAVILAPSPLVNPGRIVIPGDISSAAFFIVAALITPGSRVVLKNVGVNPTRTGLLRVLRRMKASLRYLDKTPAFEPSADLEVCHSHLQGTVVRPQEIPSLIDELPVLMVAAACARGVTLIQGVRELRVKETDRIASMVDNLGRMGVGIKIMPLRKDEQIEITPPEFLSAGSFKSFGDHRTAMSVCVASCAMKHTSTLDDASCISKSFPEFVDVFRRICRK